MKTLKTFTLTLAALCLLSFCAPSHAITALIKRGQSGTTAGNVPASFLLVDAATGQTGQSGLASTLVATVELPGGTTYSAAGGTVVDTANGTYDYWPTSTETAANGILKLHVTCTGCQPADTSVQIVTDTPGNTIQSAGSVTGAVGSVTGNVGGSVASVTAPVTVTGTVALSSGDETKIGTIGADTAGTTTLLSRLGTPTGASIDADILTRLAGSSYTAPPSLPSDYLSTSEQTKLTAAGSAGDPWATSIPGAYGTGTAGNIVGNRLDANVSSRMATFTYTAPPTAVQIRQEFDTNSSQMQAEITDILAVPGLTWTQGTRTLTTQADTPGTTTILGNYMRRTDPVQVGSYSAGQDPATLIFAGSYLTLPGSKTVSGTGETLTYKQWMALVDALPGGDNTSTAPIKSGTSTTTYYLRGTAHTSGNVVAISTVSYDASGNQTGRTVLTMQPFPAVN